MDLDTITNLARLKDIVMTLVKYGFHDLVQRLETSGFGPFAKTGGNGSGLGTPERIRMVLEELGPTFVKFGQVLSLRPDLLPPVLVRELGKLHDTVEPIAFDRIRPVVERNLGKPLEAAFRVFDTTPLAAASLSQVHRAVLADGGDIVSVKVQRPDIEKMIRTDLNILEAVARRLHERSKKF